jgi:hypothetical protein
MAIGTVSEYKTIPTWLKLKLLPKVLSLRATLGSGGNVEKYIAGIFVYIHQHISSPRTTIPQLSFTLHQNNSAL